MVQRVRLRFSKQGDLRLTSHRDLMRTVERLFRRADVAVCESEGFRPKPRVHYPASLALGMTGLEEVLEIDLVAEHEPSELLTRLNAHSVPGLTFSTVESLPSPGKKGQPKRLEFTARLSPYQADAIRENVASFVISSRYEVTRDGKTLDIRPLVEALSLHDGELIMRLCVVNEAGARPRDVMEALGLSADEILDLDITRTHVQMAS